MADDPPVAGRASRTAVFVVPGSAAGERLDVFLAEQDGLDLTRSAIQRLIRSHRVWVNGRTARPSRRLEPGEEVVIELPEPAPSGVVPEALPLDVVYEDPDVVVLNKPRGWVVHPAPGHPQGTLANALLARYPEMEGVGGPGRPGIVHRLDRDTTGLLVVARSPLAYRELVRQIKERRVHREYLALVRGWPEVREGTVEAPIGRHPADRTRMTVLTTGGRPARTHFAVVEQVGRYTLLRCWLDTGRTHQIRVHLAFIGLPVAGDPVYGGRRAQGELGLKGQALHATRLAFAHPRDGRPMDFTVPPPADFLAALERARAGAEG
ncbi:RluA family pseudouridine synthase [Thermaerobacter sp. PB12/4term]|uniref:RluA family pseudouridine synthase n=1 Tax=Thermaerobacter sp. PB12/4term TaxID=2293838 RepID=UPI000E32D02F|nr:RluA family pseudouridine synthase [Thermaerobacter sp. PB12/4term]QIA26865.1 RluA family pseudouridine synthase [Thermaerobacter sp. PB12/4term]